MSRLAISFVLFLLLCCPIAVLGQGFALVNPDDAQEPLPMSGAGILPGADVRWHRLDTTHFSFVSQVPEALTIEMASNLERLRSVLAMLAPDGRLGSPKITSIYLFEEQDTLRPFLLRHEGKVVNGVCFFVGHPHGNFAALNTDPKIHPSRFLYSQYLHQLLLEQLPQLPLWFRQGLAEYYSTFEADDNEALIGKSSPQLRRSHGYFRETQMPMEQVMTTRQAPLGDFTKSQLFLAKSWSLVHFLLNDPERRTQTNAYVRRVVDGEDSLAVFEDVYSMQIADLEQTLGAYLEPSKSLSYWKVEVSTEPLERAAFRPIPRHQSLFFIGDLILHSAPERRQEAKLYFERALALARSEGFEHGPSHAALGEVADLDGDLEAASQRYALAVKHAEGDSLVQFLYGQSLLGALGKRRPDDEDGKDRLALAIEALAKSVDAEPDFAEGWANLGFAYGLEEKASGDAVSALEHALDLLPGRTDVALNLLLAYAKEGQRESAEAIYQQLSWIGASDSDFGKASEILLQMDYREGNRLAREENRLGDAIAVFARIRAETSDPFLHGRAEERLAKFAAAAEHNQFAQSYQAVADLLKSGKADRVSVETAFKELEGLAKPGLQVEAVAALRHRSGSLLQ